MKVEDIVTGKRVKITHAPEYVSTFDGKSKILYKEEFIAPASSLVSQSGMVIDICMPFPWKCMHITINMDNGQVHLLPIEALAPTTPTNVPSITYEDVTIGDVLITNSGTAYKVLDRGHYQVSCDALTYPFSPCLINYSDVKQVLKPWPVKPHIGCLVRILKGAENKWSEPIQHEVGTIVDMLSDFEENHVVMVQFTNKTIEFINMKYLEPL